MYTVAVLKITFVFIVHSYILLISNDICSYIANSNTHVTLNVSCYGICICDTMVCYSVWN